MSRYAHIDHEERPVSSALMQRKTEIYIAIKHIMESRLKGEHLSRMLTEIIKTKGLILFLKTGVKV